MRASPARKRALSMPLSRAFSSASAIASGTISIPQTSPARLARLRPERADAAEEVEDALCARQSGHLGRDPVEALGHLRVGLEERVVGDPEAQAAELLLEVLRAERAGGAAVPLPGPSTIVWRSTGGRGISAGEVTRRLCSWPVRRPSRIDEIPEHAGARRRGRRREGPADRGPVRGARCGESLLRSEASWQSSASNDQVPAATGVEAEGELARRARRTSTPACCGSASCSTAGSIGSSSNPSRPPRRTSASFTWDCLWLELLLVRRGTARVRRGRARRRGRSAAGTRSGEAGARLRRRGLGVAALGLGHLRRDPVAGQGSGDEDDVAVAARDALAAVGQGLDVEGELLAAPRALGARGRGARASSGRAIAAYRCSRPWSRDLDEYRREAELFLEEIDREYYLQGAGHKPDLAMEPIYERHVACSSGSRSSGSGRRAGDARAPGSRPIGDDAEEARLRYLHQFALDGHLGAITRSLETRPRIWRHRSRSRWAAS